MTNETKTVLYIEDDEANRVLVRKLLRAAGYEVLLAEDGLSGVDLAMASHPALILMDMNMPGLDGYEASTRIKAIEDLHGVPIVALTANVLNGDRERSLIAGCNGYIAKPIDPDTFVEEIQRYLGGQREVVPVAEEAPLLRAYSDKLVSRLEQKVRDLSEALQQVERASRAKSDFLAMMGHEMRTPLNGIINYPDLLLADCADILSDEHKQWLANIRDSGKTLLETIGNILEYMSVEESDDSTPVAPVVFQEILQVALQHYQQAIDKKGLTVEVQFDDDLPIVYTNAQRILKAIDGLISNAVKFTEQGGIKLACTQVSASSTQLPEAIRADMPAALPYILISVTDTGIGIAEQDLQAIFQDFTQLEGVYTRRQGGIGIGLSISRKLVNAHGGKIWADSKPGEGSCFYILLPVNAPPGQEV